MEAHELNDLREFMDEFERTCNIGRMFKLISMNNLLMKDKFYKAIKNEERLIILGCIEDIFSLSNVTSKSDICRNIENGSQIISDFIYFYNRLHDIKEFSELNIEKKFRIFLHIFHQLLSYREKKCISLNTRSRDVSLYNNIVKRYMRKYIKKSTKNPNYLNTEIDLWNLFELKKGKKKNIIEEKKKVDVLCPCCCEHMIFEYYYYCENCDFIKI